MRLAFSHLNKTSRTCGTWPMQPAGEERMFCAMQQESPSDPKRVLVLQGGGALGAYQGGVYEGLAEADFKPQWIAGISIGAMNGAIIAGNAPEDRLAKLREFW